MCPPIIISFPHSLTHSFRIQHLTNINPISNRQIAVVVSYEKSFPISFRNFYFDLFLFILFIFFFCDVENFHLLLLYYYFSVSRDIRRWVAKRKVKMSHHLSHTFTICIRFRLWKNKDLCAHISSIHHLIFFFTYFAIIYQSFQVIVSHFSCIYFGYICMV